MAAPWRRWFKSWPSARRRTPAHRSSQFALPDIGAARTIRVLLTGLAAVRYRAREVGLIDRMREPGTADVIEGALKRILECEQHQPIEILPPRLDALFRTLADSADIAAAIAIEDEIWALWTDHPDRELRLRMDHAIAALAGRRFDEARTLLDDIVRDEPLWPEAWNERATPHFLIGGDRASIRDIERTLSMEPRHFGAISGFAQICLRNGQPVAALAALEIVLRIHPSLPAVRRTVHHLTRPASSTIH